MPRKPTASIFFCIMNQPTGTVFQQLRQRKLVQILLLYLGVGWGLAQVAEFAVDNYDLSRRVIDVTLFLIILGLPAVGVIGWYHGEKGHQRVQRGEALMLGLLLVMAGIGTYRIGTAEPAIDRNLSAVVDLGSHSVAVMPFRNRLTDPSLEWLSTGASELLTTGLAGLSSIRVVSGHRLYDLLRQEGHEDATEIPEALATRLTRMAGARFMIDGSILGRKGDLVMTADLVNVETGDIEASTRVRGADVFALIDSIAADLSAQIAGETVEPTELASVASFTTRNQDAYREYMLALRAERRFHQAEALEGFQRAVVLDSTFALAQIRLATAAFGRAQISVGIQALKNAQKYRDEAPERDRLLLDAMLAQIIHGDAAESRRILTDLVAMYPDDRQARSALVRLYDGRSPERGRLLEETILFDPFDADTYNQLAYFRAHEGNFAAADSLVQRYIELEPDQPNPLDSRGEILMIAGRQEEARESFRAALKMQPDFGVSLEHLAESWAADGRFGEGELEIGQFIEASEPQARLAAYRALAILRTREGDLSGSVEALETRRELATQVGDSGIRNSALLSQIVIFVALQDWDRLTERESVLHAADPLNPFPTFSHLIRLGETGRLSQAEAYAHEIRAALDSVPGVSDFRAVLNAMLERDLSFYRGEFAAAVVSAAAVREQGNMPELGSFSEVRALLALGRYEEVLERTWQIGGFTGPPEVLGNKQQAYFLARAHEGLADTTAAVASNERLLNANWREGVRLIPLLADAPDRLAALQAPH